MSRPVLPPAAVDYPTSDGKPLAENDAQARAILYAFGALRVHYEARSDVYVSADLLIYYEEGNPRVSVAPDVFVVFGVEDRMRGNYKVWEEGKGPDFVLEVASPGTWREDVGPKRSVYARLGVREYFLYDPTGEHLTPRLQGHRLEGEVYERLSAVESIDRTLAMRSEVLGLELQAKGGGRCASTTRRPSRRFSVTARSTPRGGLSWCAPRLPKRASRNWRHSLAGRAADRTLFATVCWSDTPPCRILRDIRAACSRTRGTVCTRR